VLCAAVSIFSMCVSFSARDGVAQPEKHHAITADMFRIFVYR